jgi:hypothetical protein
MACKTLPLSVALCTLALLGGCATPLPSLSQKGALPSAGSYAFAEADSVPEDVKGAIATTLGQHSLTPAEQPQYLVQASYSQPIAKTGTLVPNKVAQQWQRQPARGGKPLARVTLSVTEVASGTEVYHAAAWQPASGKPGDALALTNLALAPADPTTSAPPKPIPAPPPAQ